MKNRSLVRRKRRSQDEFVNEPELIKNYFKMKGHVGSNELQDKFEQDIFYQLRMAEKVGVYAALQDIKFDVDS